MGVILGQNRPESDLRRLRSADQYRLQYRVLPPAGRNQLININYFPYGGPPIRTLFRTLVSVENKKSI